MRGTADLSPALPQLEGARVVDPTLSPPGAPMDDRWGGDAIGETSPGMGLPAGVHQSTMVAIGIVVARRRCGPQQALATLIDLATRTDRSIIDIAECLIASSSTVESPGPTA